MKTLKEKLVVSLSRSPLQNINELTVRFDKPRVAVREKLYTAKRQGLVKDRWIRKRTPWGGPVLMHVWELTESGKEWVRQEEV